MEYIDNICFALVFITGITFFTKSIRKIIRNIRLGQSIERSDNQNIRLKNMLRIAFGQSKMVKKPIAGFLHLIVYIGFIVINIELLEIIIDGLFGTHRVFAFIGTPYNYLIGAFEVLAFLVLVAVVVFWVRRNVIKIKRFLSPEMKGWPKSDGNLILYFEIVLMLLFLTMNASDYLLQALGAPHYAKSEGIIGAFPISKTFIVPLLSSFDISSLIVVERLSWWLHIVGILVFLNYLYFSKHLHILLAFPNTYYGNIAPKGKFRNLESVTNEVKLMMDPDADPFATPDPAETTSDNVPDKFGASDVIDLNWVQLLNAYTCTECGRCTSECPANQTGKKLSPRKIMMDTRDRLEEVGKNIDKNGSFVPDGKQLLNDYISKEELWACTTCNACVEACPVSIDPLSIINEMRTYLVMEESAAPTDLNNMMSNIENNGAPWPFNQMDRLNWSNEK